MASRGFKITPLDLRTGRSWLVTGTINRHQIRRQFSHQDEAEKFRDELRWRKRLGEAGAEAMLKATIEAGVAMKVIAGSHVQHVNVDTTVQTKAFRHPTDSRLYDRARERLVAHARKADSSTTWWARSPGTIGFTALLSPPSKGSGNLRGLRRQERRKRLSVGDGVDSPFRTAP